jgi:uncharacterized protein (DUF58 family)
VITWRVAVLFAALAGATVWWTGQPVLTLVGALGAALLLAGLDWVVAASPGEVTLRRDGPVRVRLGDSVTVTLWITNGSVRVLRAMVRDAWVPSAGATGPYSHALIIDPGGTVDIATVLTPTRRGDRKAARVTVRSYGPLGLAFRQTSGRAADRLTPEWTLRTLPEFRSRRFLPEKLARLRVIDGQVVARGRGQGQEFDSLRDYVTGDDPRAIDWRASARRNHIVVKQWRPERDRRVLCVLDTGRTSAARIGLASRPLDADQTGEPRLDIAIDAVLLLATLAANAGDRVDLLALDATTHVNLSTNSKRALPRFLDAVAPLQPALAETDFGRVVAEVLSMERKRALVVLFTTLDPAALGEGLLPVLPMLIARHTVVVAAVHDPALGALASARAGSVALHTAGSAETALGELARVSSALTRAGVQVVDAPAETFASAVADRYLDLKAAGRL